MARIWKDMDFFSFGQNLSKKYGKKLLDAATKTGLNALKTTTKR